MRSSRTRRSAAAATLALAAVTAPLTAATAETAAACARLRAEARGEAALLYAPRLEVEGARAPGVSSPADPTAAAAAGLQARVALALSPVDMLRGRAIERVADAECASDHVSHRIDWVLAIGPRFGELAATRAELDYLDHHLGEVDALVAELADAFARQRATALEVDELRGRRTLLRRRLTDLRHSEVVLAELDRDAGEVPDLDQLAATSRAATLDVDRRRADVRALSAWRLDLRAGVAGADEVDYFAVVELGYSLGQPWQRRAERRALRARAAELTDDERSVPVRVARLRAAMRASVAVLTDEAADLDAELATLRAERARLDGLDSDAARALRNRSTVAVIEAEARRVSVTTLAAARRALVGGAP